MIEEQNSSFLSMNAAIYSVNTSFQELNPHILKNIAMIVLFRKINNITR